MMDVNYMLDFAFSNSITHDIGIAGVELQVYTTILQSRNIEELFMNVD